MQHVLNPSMFAVCAGQLVQLNAGGRQVASDRGWQVVDFERLASWFADPKVSFGWPAFLHEVICYLLSSGSPVGPAVSVTARAAASALCAGSTVLLC